MRLLLLVILTALSVGLAACDGSGAAGAAGAATASQTPQAALATHTPSPAPSNIAHADATVGSPVGTPSAPSATPQPAGTPTRVPSPTPCADTRGQMVSLNIPSATLRRDIESRVYLPPCYAFTGNSYPVLYLIHGLNFTEDQWERLGVPEVADDLIARGEIAPLIVVMPRDRGDSRLDPAFVDDVLPYIDGRYRTLAERQYRAIGGLSRGAGWSVRLGLHYPQHFSRIGAHSPALFHGDENWLIQWTNAIVRSGELPVAYIDIGQDDAQRRSAYWLDEIFVWFNLGHTFIERPGDHTEKYWSTHLPDYLRFYAADWRAAPAPTSAPTAGPE